MRKRTVYLILQTALCCALAALLAVSAVSIWREGSALRLADPTADIYTPRIISEKTAPAAPVFFAFVCLLIAGLVLNPRDERADRPAEDAALARDLAVGRVNRPSEAMLRERAVQRRLQWLGRGVFALCMVPIAAHLLDPDHFTPDLEAMFLGLLRVFLPWTAAGLAALAAAAALCGKHELRETEAARQRAREELAEGMAPARRPVAAAKGRGTVRAAILIAAAALIVAGVLNGSARDVLYKAITICTECVGLG